MTGAEFATGDTAVVELIEIGQALSSIPPRRARRVAKAAKR